MICSTQATLASMAGAALASSCRRTGAAWMARSWARVRVPGLRVSSVTSLLQFCRGPAGPSCCSVSLKAQRSARDHWQVEALLLGAVDGDVVTGIGVAHHTSPRVVGQYASNTLGGLIGTVADDDHARVLG